MPQGHKRKRDTKSSMPPEVALIIVEHCFDQDFATFLNCLQVCKNWFELGWRLPRKDIYVNDKSLERVVKALSGTQAQLVKSMTIQLFADSMPSIMLTTQLCLLMSRLPHLESLSLLGYYTLPGLSGELRDVTRSFASLFLDAAPERLRRLELQGFVESADNPADNSHLCPRISRLLPQLVSLRLARTSCCPTMFGTLPCERRSHLSLWVNSINLPLHQYGQDSVSTHDILKEAVEHLASRQYPQIERFVMGGSLSPGQAEARNLLLMQTGFRIDLVRSQTAAFPIQTLKHTGGCSWMRYQEDPSSDPVDLIRNYFFPKSFTRGHGDVILQDEWLQSSRKIRLPRQLAETRNYRWTNGDTFSLFRLNQEDYRKERPETIKLWTLEGAAGHLLLRPSFTEGTSVPTHLSLAAVREQEQRLQAL